MSSAAGGVVHLFSSGQLPPPLWEPWCSDFATSIRLSLTRHARCLLHWSKSQPLSKYANQPYHWQVKGSFGHFVPTKGSGGKLWQSCGCIMCPVNLPLWTEDKVPKKTTNRTPLRGSLPMFWAGAAGLVPRKGPDLISRNRLVQYLLIIDWKLHLIEVIQ